MASPEFERQKFSTRTIKLADYGLDILGYVIITNDKMIKEHPEVVRGFARATLRGLAYMIDHPDEAVDIAMTRFDGLNRDTERKRLEVWIPYLWNQDAQQYGLGHQSKERWEQTEDVLYRTGFNDKRIDPTTVYTTEFLSS